MTKYPLVRGEEETLTRVLAGASIARYGDGEFKHCNEQRNVSQTYHARLSARLRDILIDSGSCMVGIPNIHSKTPKWEFWNGFQRYAIYLEASRQYVSSFITRPDSAPWIATDAYFERLESLWRGYDVTLVRGSSKSLTAEDLIGARRVTEILAPIQNAFSDYDSLLARVGRPDRVLLCIGPTATVMAVDLCARGVHAIDLGHAGMFLRKWRRGDPMTVTEKDRGKKVKAV